jgi:hypothetical protein
MIVPPHHPYRCRHQFYQLTLNSEILYPRCGHFARLAAPFSMTATTTTTVVSTLSRRFHLCYGFALALLFGITIGLALAPSYATVLWIAGPVSLVLLFAFVRWLPPTAKKARVVLAVLVVTLLAWMAWDDSTLDEPRPIAELAPLPPRGAESAELTLRFTPHDGRPAAIFPAPKTRPDKLWAADRVAQQEFLAANADSIRADWEAGTALRDWITELSAFGPIGDTTVNYDSPHLATSALRMALQLHCAYASLLAYEGHGDTALAVLAPVLTVSRQLQPASRTLIRFMASIYMQRQAQQTARFILDTATVSPAGRRVLAAALQAGGELPATLRQTFVCEYVISPLSTAPGSLEEARDVPWWHQVFRPVFGLIYNPKATANLLHEFYQQIGTLAADRQLDELRSSRAIWMETMSRPTPKNSIGRVVLIQSVPNFDKVVESAWQTEDARLALLATLRDRLAAFPTK